MAEFKLVVNDVKTGRSYQKAMDTDVFKSKRIGDVILGDTIGLKGYELKITGGSDKQGFPIRYDMPGTGRRKALLTRGPGVHIKRKGMKKRKAVRGSTISLDIAQVNLKTTKYGVQGIEKLWGIKQSEKKEEKAEANVETKEASKPKEGGNKE